MKKRGKRKICRFMKPAALLFAGAGFALLIIPFIITSVFTPKEISGETPAKPPQTPVADSIEEVSIPDHIKVHIESQNVTKQVPFEQYVKGVVASEMPCTFETEALKAQAIAARTYSLSKYIKSEENGNPRSHSTAPVCDTVHCQVYQDENSWKKSKGADADKWDKISAAVDSTKGRVMYYKGKLVEQALFHSSSGGKTENCEDVFTAAVPYLVSVDSPYEDEATHKKETLTLTLSDFAAKMKAAFPGRNFGDVRASNIKIQGHSSGGRVQTVKIGNASASGKEVREALGLYSANFKISIRRDKIAFTTTGSGHGVGMSQYGANGMAKKGYTCEEILSHYYSGITVYPRNP